jgi:hypothetical protein
LRRCFWENPGNAQLRERRPDRVEHRQNPAGRREPGNAKSGAKKRPLSSMVAERGELPLSNPAETINLAGIADPGIGWCLGSVYALAAVRCRTHIRTADPAAGSDRERRSGKRCWELCDGCR